MTNVEALLSGTGAATSASATDARRAGRDWRQAVEQAQADAWLRDRNLAPGRDHPLEAAGQDAQRPVAAPPAGPEALQPWPSRVGTTLAVPVAVHPLGLISPAVEAAAAPPVSVSAPLAGSVQVLPLSDGETTARVSSAQSTVIGQGEVFRAARPRKQSIHSELDERGVSVWIRDASLNSHEAMHLAAAMASAASFGRQDLVALYLNGHPVADGSESSSFPLSE